MIVTRPKEGGHSRTMRSERRIGLCRKFGSGGHEGALPLSEGGLSGHSEELCGRSEGVVSLLDHQLPFLEHVHQFDTNQS